MMESSCTSAAPSSPSSTLTSMSQIESGCDSDLYSFSNTCSLFNDTNFDIYKDTSYISSDTCICNVLENLSEKEIEIDPKNETDIKELLLQFNNYFKTKAKNIQEITSILIQQNNTKAKTVKRELHRNSVEEENNNLKLLNTQLQSKLSQLEHQLSTITNQNSTLIEKNNLLAQKVSSLQNAITSMEGVIEGNLLDINSLGQQRETLLNVISRQTSIIHKLESESTKKYAQFSPIYQEQPAPKQTAEDTNCYSILCSIARQAIDSLEKEHEKIEKIRGDSTISLDERILLIVQLIVDAGEQKSNKILQLEKKLENSNQTITNLRYKITETLAMFEAQHRFLSNLTHSTDLQNTMFWDEQSGKVRPLTQPNREELVRRCARFGQFIEETLGEVTLEKYEEIIGSQSKLDFFELLRPQNFVNSMESLLDRLENSNQITENNDMREIFDLLCAQVLMNYVLKNYAQELRNVVDVNRLRLAKIPAMEAEAAAAQDAESVGEKELRKALRREKAVRDYIGQMMDFENDIETPKLVKKAISSLKHALRDCVSRVEEYQKQTTDFLNEKKEHQKEKDNLKNQITELQNQFENLNIEAAQKDLLLSENDEKMEMKKKENSELKEKLKKSDKKIKELSAKIEAFDGIVDSIKKQRAALGAKMESIQKSSEDMKARHAAEKKQLLDNYSAQIEAAKNQIAQTTSELTEEREKNNNLASKVEEMTAALTKANVELKSFEMRLKSVQQKAEMEYQNQQMKAQAIAASQAMEMSSKLAEKERLIEEAFHILASIVGGNDLKDSLSLIECEIKRLKEIESKYLELMIEVDLARDALNIGSEIKISEAIQQKLFELEQRQKNTPIQQNVNPEVEKKLRESQKEIEKIRNRLRSVDEQLSQLKQWEHWARRLHSVCCETDASAMSPEDIRLSLGEYLLSSVSQRHLSYVIESLRIQKQFILAHRSLILEKSDDHPSLHCVILAAITIKRMQRFAGCLQFAPLPNVEKRRSHKRNDSSHASKKDRNPIIPLFV